MWCIYVYIYIHTRTHAYMYTLEYYSAIEKNEIRPFAATWVDPETVISQRRKNI